jgi:mannose-6-phosphate isomerase
MKPHNFGVTMELILPPTEDKEAIFTAVSDYLGNLSLNVVDTDLARPWGGFFVIDEAQTQEFIAQYFPDMSTEQIERGGRLSPKVLVVAPDKRLSWQYHNRREELWRVIEGPVGVVVSEHDEQPEAETLPKDTVVQHGVRIRHRLIGLENWGVVAEIWQHTEIDNPSDESDIVRVQDDFSRL